MNKARFFKNVKKYHTLRAFMSTEPSFVENDVKKLEHYRNLNEMENSFAKPADWLKAKPFEEVPGPKPLPIIGNTWRFFVPKLGNFYGLDFTQIHKMLHAQYGDTVILNGLLGIPPILLLFNPTDIEKLHRNEGVWPIRNGLPSFAYYRKMRKNILPSEGLVALQGEEWYKFRSIVNPILMQPKNVALYTDKMNIVADELIDNIRYFSEQNPEGQMPDDFQHKLYQWSLESIGLVTMDTHLGCLKRDAQNPEAQKLIKSVVRMFELMYKLDVLPSPWKLISTPAWREYVKTLDFILETNLKHINYHLEKLERGEIEHKDNEIPSALIQMLKKNPTVAKAMSVDMLTAGIDTTGRVLSAALYYLSKNPEIQNKLREEAFSLLKEKNSPVTREVLSKALYTKATIKETTRLAPIAIGTLRSTKKDVVLGGYQVPAGISVLTSNLVLCQQDKYFPRAKDFIPERWLPTTTGELSHKNTNPFIFAPFGVGPRSCIGKRIANLELETALLKIIRNFDLKWPHEDMVFTLTTLYGIGRPLRLHVKPLN